MKKKYKYYVIPFVIIIAGFVFLNSKLEDKAKRDFHKFYSAAIAGRVTYLYGSTGGSYFRVNNSDQEYNILSIIDPGLNKNQTLSTAAEIGDSISKRSFADTLYLIKKEGSIYRYTFTKLK